MTAPGILAEQYKPPWFWRCPECWRLFVFRHVTDETGEDGTTYRVFECSRCGHSECYAKDLSPETLGLSTGL